MPSRDPIRAGPLARALAPARVVVWPRVRSTQERARAMLETGELSPSALLIAARQTAGRGRGANRWWSDGGSLCATFVLPAIEGMPIGQAPLRAGLAVAETLARYLPREAVRLKWPNDVVVRGRKICGILCARVRGADVIGIGLNVSTRWRGAPPEVRAGAVSLADLIPRPPPRSEVLAALWAALTSARAAPDWRERYLARHALEGRWVDAACEGRRLRGRCVGVDEEGRLLLDIGGERRALTDATVRLAQAREARGGGRLPLA